LEISQRLRATLYIVVNTVTDFSAIVAVRFTHRKHWIKSKPSDEINRSGIGARIKCSRSAGRKKPSTIHPQIDEVASARLFFAEYCRVPFRQCKAEKVELLEISLARACGHFEDINPNQLIFVKEEKAIVPPCHRAPKKS